MHDPARNPYTRYDKNRQRSDRDLTFPGAVRTGQIITFALIVSIVFVAVTLIFLTLSENKPADLSILMPAIGASIGVLTWITALVVPSMLRRQAESKLAARVDPLDRTVTDNESMEPSLQEFVAAQNRATLIGQSILDGGAVINLILMFLDNWLVIHLSFAAAAIIGIASMTPTTTRLRHAIEQAKL